MNRLHKSSTNDAIFECLNVSWNVARAVRFSFGVKSEKLNVIGDLRWSGRLDSNQRPFAPEAGQDFTDNNYMKRVSTNCSTH
jgi:hypothetical protein